MIVIQCIHNGAYQLAELDSAVSQLCYAAFHLIQYHVCLPSFIPVTHIMDGDELTSHEDDDTSRRGAGSSGDESTQEGDKIRPVRALESQRTKGDCNGGIKTILNKDNKLLHACNGGIKTKGKFPLQCSKYQPD